MPKRCKTCRRWMLPELRRVPFSVKFRFYNRINCGGDCYGCIADYEWNYAGEDNG